VVEAVNPSARAVKVAAVGVAAVEAVGNAANAAKVITPLTF
jgi:hypothetical protein